MTVNRQSIDDIFGTTNVAKWADLENQGSSVHVDARIAWAISIATKYVQAQVKTTTYSWASVQDDVLIEHVTSLKAGLLLYSNRSVSATGKDKPGDPMDTFKAMYKDFWKAINAGELSLGDDENEICRAFPGVVKDGIDISTPKATA